MAMSRAIHHNARRAKPVSGQQRGTKRHMAGWVSGVSVAVVIVVALLAVMLYHPERVPGVDGAAASSVLRFEPTKVNTMTAPVAAPEGMAWIPGGEFSMGANDPPDMDDVGMKATEDARPIHRVYVDGFFMDTTDVTNAQFDRFVKATGYVTIAERTPR